MIGQVACVTCGKRLGALWEYWNAKVKEIDENTPEFQEGELKNFIDCPKKKLLDELGLTRICCRRTMLGNTDVFDLL